MMLWLASVVHSNAQMYEIIRRQHEACVQKKWSSCVCYKDSRVLLKNKTWARAKTKVFTQSVRHAAENIDLLPLEQRVKFTALFLADNAWEPAAIPTVEMCQLLMGLSIETRFPEDPGKIDIVVLTVTLQTAETHTLTYQSYHSSSANTPLWIYTHAHTLYISDLFYSSVTPLH